MITGMYKEMPGLTLNLQQAARLFGVRVGTCKAVLEDLVAASHLTQVADGQYTLP
jgi:hypothetical protein